MKASEIKPFVGSHVLLYAGNHVICAGNLCGMDRQNGQDVLHLHTRQNTYDLPVSSVFYVTSAPSNYYYG